MESTNNNKVQKGKNSKVEIINVSIRKERLWLLPKYSFSFVFANTNLFQLILITFFFFWIFEYTLQRNIILVCWFRGSFRYSYNGSPPTFIFSFWTVWKIFRPCESLEIYRWWGRRATLLNFVDRTNSVSKATPNNVSLFLLLLVLYFTW